MADSEGSYPALHEFAAGYPFTFDSYQIQACRAVEDGSGVLLAAPTGAGKTVVGEFAAFMALRTGRKCFYTTPVKALSNQKYLDLARRHGAAQVGLLTGDNTVNGEAPVVVMTTEVLRNMLYAGSPTLRGLGWVVMDEVHYLADRFRGPVWEEVILHLPASVALVSLSATVSNTEELGEWLVTVRGRTEVVVDEVRPVPLWQHMMVDRRLYDLLDHRHPTRVDPELVRDVTRRLHHDGPPDRGRRGRAPDRPGVVTRLDSHGLLPAICFVFSRAGCDGAVRQCLAAGLRLTTDEEAAEIRSTVDARTAGIAGEDLSALGFREWRQALERGIAAHHAGMLPTFKEVVEDLFVRGLVRVVFATETLAVGVNMPARTVILERLDKWNGEAHAPVTPGEYTQLTGRAGRRGIDVEGHAVVLWAPDVDPERVAGLASSRTFPLRSSFRPSYNMAVNLVGSMGRERAAALLESSFAQFQADRAVVGSAQKARRNRAELDKLAAQMVCDLGDFAEYARLRDELSRRESDLAKERGAARRAATITSLEQLRPGEVIEIRSGRRTGRAVVVDPGLHPHRDPAPLVVTEQRWAGRLSLAELRAPVRVVGRIRLPRTVNHRSPQVRRDIASSLRNLETTRARPAGGAPDASDGAGLLDDSGVRELRAALRGHPCHHCPDREQHARVGERWHSLRRETEALERTVAGRTTSLSRTFARVCGLLELRGYLDGDVVTDSGHRLARLWAESDLLIAESLGAGIWEGLTPAESAAAVSAVVYESRSSVVVTGGAVTVVTAPQPVRRALAALTRVWADLVAAETAQRLAFVRRPDVGFAGPAYAWAAGRPLAEVLAEAAAAGTPLTAGDFVRWCRQVVDLLGQLRDAAPEASTVGPAAAAAMTVMRRGVVQMSPFEE